MDPHLNYGYKTVPQEFAGRQVDYHRGKGLGGSSAINFAAWTLGPKDDYDEWARIAGDSNLDWENTQRRFKNIESYDINISKQYHKYANPDPKVHGSNGGVHVEIPPVWERDFPDVLDASEGYGWPLNQDINSGDPLGMVCTVRGIFRPKMIPYVVRRRCPYLHHSLSRACVLVPHAKASGVPLRLLF